MAMQKKTWSINALSTELDLDRRTLAKRLDGLAPATEKKVGDRTEKRWHLADVLAHFENPKPADDFIAEQKKMVGALMYPALVSAEAFQNIIMHGVHEEIGLTKVQAMRVYQLACVAVLWGFNEIHEDEGIEYAIPDHVKDMQETGLDAYVEKHWPN
jgi:hypothetical protein